MSFSFGEGKLEVLSAAGENLPSLLWKQEPLLAPFQKHIVAVKDVRGIYL